MFAKWGFFRRKNDREQQRFQVVPVEIRGLLTDVKGEGQQPFLVWDISSSGIGIWVAEKLTQGERIVLTFGQPYVLVVQCEVMWVDPHENHGFRCGLHVLEGEKEFVTLINLFQKNHS